MKKYIVGFIVGLLVLAGYVAGGAGSDELLGRGGNSYSCQLPLFANVATPSTTSVGTGNNMVLPTSTSRSYVSIFNAGDERVAIAFGTAAVANEGYTLTPSSTLVISPCGDLFTKSSIQATTNSGAGTADLNILFKHVAE